jgi:8-oxo-dGTP pyrophosphatase MutT (NUDIX family)
VRAQRPEAEGLPLTDAIVQRQFPELFTPVHWGPVEAVFVPRQTLPPRALIGNVNVIAFVGDDAVILRVADGRLEIPGGTLEPDEDYLAALRRELSEEAGARLRSFKLLGAWRCRSSASAPYRPHLPHPIFYRVVGYGDVDLLGPPTNPDGGEQIVDVAVVPVEEAAALFRRWQRPDIAALYALAHDYRHTAASGEPWSDRGRANAP